VHVEVVFKPNPVEFELPYEEGLLLDVRPEWIAEQKVQGVRALLEFGRLHTPHTTIPLPGPLPEDWKSHVLDGVLVQRTFYMFDVLMMDFEDARQRPLHERRTLLRSLRLPAWCRPVPCGKNIGEFLEAVVNDGGEGIVLKSLLQPYGRAEWIKVERLATEDVVIMALHMEDRCATFGQFQGDELVDLGTVFLGSLVDQAWPGQVIEVALNKKHASPYKNCRFIRFRPDVVAAQCRLQS